MTRDHDTPPCATELHDPGAYQGPTVDDDGASRDPESMARIARAQARRRAAQRDRRLDTWSARDGWARRPHE